MPPSPKLSAAPDEPTTQSPVRAHSPEALAKDAPIDTAEDSKEEISDTEPGNERTEPHTKTSKAAEKAPADADEPPIPNEPLPAGPPLPNEPTPDGPPLPKEPVPESGDDGWDCQWDPTTQAWFFVNRFTGKSQWENPRVTIDAAPAVASSATVPQPPTSEKPAAGGYNPAIHGDYDPNAWYAQGNNEEEAESSSSAAAQDQSHMYGVTASFNRFTGQFQTEDMGPNRHSDEAKSRRQMNAFFDVDAAANAHDGRSLKAERSGKKPSKAEVKAFKEKRRARKEEKRRAWLRD